MACMEIGDPDIRLLEQWRTHRDADAFAELAARHGPMVYAVCLRVLRNAEAAQDAAQECFLECVRTKTRVRSLPAWLHTTATRRALDQLKTDRRRNAREARYVAGLPTATQPEWDEVST